MSNWKSKRILGSLFLLALLLVPIATGPFSRVYADDDGPPLFKLCDLPNKNRDMTDGQTQFATIEFINRISFKVTFKPAGVQCKNDRSKNIQFIYGNIDLSPYVNGTYTDNDTTDNFWMYKGAAYQSFIKRFVTSGTLKRDNYHHIDTYSDDELKTFLSKAEIVFRVDESKVKNGTGSSDHACYLDGKDLFFDLNKDGGSWRCRDDEDEDNTGFHVLQAMPNIQSIRNFNIAFAFTGTDIVPLEKKNDSGWHFKTCSNVKGKRGTVLGTGQCATGNSFVELSDAEINRLKGNGNYELNVYRSVADADAADPAKVSHKITVGGSNAPSVAGTAAVAAGASGSAQDGKCRGGALSFIFCPLIEAMTGAIDKIYNDIVTPLLETKQYILKDANGADSSIYKAWSSFRIYGDIFLLMALIAIVFGQSIGGGLIDAYTAKKVLPRLLIAGVLINISIYLVAFLVDITNIVGLGISDLLKQPFRVQPNAFELTFTGAGNSSVGLIAIVAGFGAALVYQFVLLMFLIPVFLNFLAILVTLLVRQALIIFLVIISPVAFAMYCLPNTEQYYKKWWNLLSNTLLVFPIVSVLFAMGQIMSHIVGTANIGGKFSDFLAILAYVAPLFFISFAFKLAGGIMSGIANFSDGKAGGFNARMAKSRQARMARKKADWHAGSSMQDRGLGKLVNSAGRRSAAGARGRFGFGATGKAALATDMLANNEDALRNNARLKELRNNDDANAVLALSGGTSSGAKEAAKELFTDDNGVLDQTRHDKAMAAASAVGFTRQNASAALQTAAQNKWRAVRPGRTDIIQNGINRLGGRNEIEREQTAFSNQYFNREAGRGDLGGYFSSEGMQERAKDLAQRNGTTEQEAMSDLSALDGMGRTEVPSMVRGYPAQMKQNATTLKRMVKYGNDQERELAATRILEMQKALSYASGDNQKTITDLVESVGVDYTSGDSIETQLARIASAGATTPVDATALSRKARTYDQEQARGPNGPLSGPTAAPGP